MRIAGMRRSGGWLCGRVSGSGGRLDSGARLGGVGRMERLGSRRGVGGGRLRVVGVRGGVLGIGGGGGSRKSGGVIRGGRRRGSGRVIRGIGRRVGGGRERNGIIVRLGRRLRVAAALRIGGR